MAEIPKISDELLLRAFSRPSLGQALQAGTEGFGQGVDIGSKLAEQKAKRKKEEQDLMQQIEALKMSKRQQTLKEKESKAGMISPSLVAGLKQEVTPEVFSVLYPKPTKIEEEKAPAGYRFKADGSLEPIPGSAEAVKREKESKAEQAEFTQHLDKAKFSKKFVDDTIPKVTKFTAGPGSVLKAIPGTPARNLASDIQSIKSRIGLESLMAAKATSPTGASGFGQLSDKEMELLQAQVANLDQAQDYKQLKDRLSMISTHYDNALALIQGKNPYNDKNPAPLISTDLSSISTDDLLRKLSGGK